MTTAEAERIITDFYGDDHDGLCDDLKLYARDGYKTVEAIALDLIDRNYEQEAP